MTFVNYDRTAAMYRSIIRCPECDAVIEESGFEYPHAETCINKEESND